MTYKEKELHRCIHCDKEIVLNYSRYAVHFYTGELRCNTEDENSTIATPKKGVRLERAI